MQVIKSENLSDKERGYLLGLFLGDGYSGYSKNDRHYNTDFYLHALKDRDIQEYLVSLLRAINMHPQLFKDRRFAMNRIRVSSKQFLHFIEREVARFNARLYVNNASFLLGVVSGLIDAEGCVYRGTISFCQKDTVVAQEVQRICILLGVNCSLKQRPNPPGTIWRAYISTQFKHLSHISRKVQREYGSSRASSKPL